MTLHKDLCYGAFFIKVGTGNPYHEHHPCRESLRVPTKLLTNDEIKLVKDLHTARAKVGVAVGTHFVQSLNAGTPTTLSQNQVKYLVGKSKSTISKDDKDDVAEHGETDDLFKYLDDRNASYVALLQKKSIDSGVVVINDTEEASLGCLFNETKIGQDVTLSKVPMEDAKEMEAATFAQSHQEALGIADNQEIMVGIAFGLPFELKQFKIFHSIVHVDATMDTNLEKRPLVTITCKDSFGQMFTALRVFLPNEKAYSFKWLFLTVFPALLGKDVLQHIKVIVTDGDSQEIQQLEEAIKTHFPDAYRIRCSWHIIDCGWNRLVRGAPLGFNRKKKGSRLIVKKTLTPANSVSRTIYRWMFSWAMPMYCDNKDEFQLSVTLFVKYVESDGVKSILGEGAVSSILKLLCESVLPHTQQFAYYCQRNIFHLETHTNTGHEGTNNGMKHCAPPVGPQSKLEQTAKTLSFNAEIKINNTKIRATQKASSKKLWSESLTSPYVTDLCEALLQKEWNKIKNYVAARVGTH